MRIFGKVIKIMLVLFIAVLLVMMGVRMYQTGDQKPLSTLSPALAEAAEEHTVMTYHQSDPLSEDGVLYAYAVYYVKETGDLQVTVRYSTRLIDRIQQLHPAFSDKDIRISIRTVKGEEIIEELEGELLDTTDKYIYRYKQFLFRNVSFENIDAILANIYFENIEEVSVPSSVGIWFNDGLEENYRAK